MKLFKLFTLILGGILIVYSDHVNAESITPTFEKILAIYFLYSSVTITAITSITTTMMIIIVSNPLVSPVVVKNGVVAGDSCGLVDVFEIVVFGGELGYV